MEKKIHCIKEMLVEALENQAYNLEKVNAEEMGEVVDMVKDLEEALYYHAITKAMKEPKIERKHHQDYESQGWVSYSTHSPHEGNSGKLRKVYMEAKETHTDKTIHLKELEDYLKELSQDIHEMIADASVEEKQLLQRKLLSLSNKISQTE